MHHEIERIICKSSDYKKCPHCLNINWYENENCIDCGKSMIGGRPLRKEDLDELVRVFDDITLELGV